VLTDTFTRREYGLAVSSQMSEISGQKYESVILAVGHEEFREMGAEAIRALAKPDGILYDIKYVFPKNAVDGRL
jgi:UDP-N-acetyl-D-glucosamine/UDP-N-acetyl-D-galactosamine dehydrogenase